MSINIERNGNRVYKVENGVTTEIFGAERTHYVLEMKKIDRGEKAGERKPHEIDSHDEFCICRQCCYSV